MKKNLLRILLFFSIVGLTATVNAETVRTSLSVPFNESSDNWVSFNGLGTKDIYVNDWSGYVGINLSKVFNFSKNDGSILKLNSTLNIGEKINPYTSSTEGNYSVVGNSFNIGQGARFVGENCWTHMCHNWKRIYEVFNPVESGDVKIISTNPSVVECVKNICTSKSPGVANIVVDFPNKTQTGLTEGAVSVYEVQFKIGFPTELVYYNVKTSGNTYYGLDYGYGNIMIGGYGRRTTSGDTVYTNNLKNTTYSYPSITYTITVPGKTNTPQDSTCTGTSNITKNSATVNWTYTDVDNDPQTQYQVQLSTDPAFALENIVFASSSASANTSHTFTGLTASTTYYSRVKTYNTTNAWSVYSSCSSTFTTLKDDEAPVSKCSCEKRDYVCRNTDGTTASTLKDDAQCAFETYCSTATDATDVTFTFGPSKNNLGTKIIYEHSGISAERDYPSFTYTHKITKIPGIEQSLTVKSTDTYDNTWSSKTCSVNNNVIPPPDEPPGEICTPSPTTLCNPKITIVKTPRITLNKGGTCTLNWKIEERPADMICTLSGGGDPIPLTKSSGINSFPNLQKNTKYTISCTGGTPPKTISESVICRINPSAMEI